MTQPESPSVAEPDTGAQRRIRVLGLAVGLVAAILVALAGPGLSQPLFDLFQRIMPAPDLSPRVHVVVVDADSLRDIGGWPWSRFYMARLVEQISARGAAAIGIDILLPERDRADPADFANLYTELPPGAAAQVRDLPSMDALFARVVGRAPVVLARAGVRPGSFDFLERTQAPLPPEAQFTGQPPRDVLQFPTVIANLPVIDSRALGHGLVNGDRDPDGVVRRVPLVARAAGSLTPGFALELVRVAEGASRIDLKGADGRMTAACAGRACVPSTPDGQLLLRFGDWRETQTTSAANLLRRGMPDDLFKGQIVVVGLAMAGGSDVVGTPSDRAVSGVFIQAQAVDAVLRGSGLIRPAWAAAVEWGLCLLTVLAAWFAAPRAPVAVVAAVGIAGATAAFAASALAFQRDLLLDPFPMTLPWATTAAAMLMLLYLEGRRLQARLRSALDDERRSAEGHQQALINELNHRVKNTLSTVQAMAMQTLRPERGAAEAREAFVARLMALSAAHNLLNVERWGSTDLDAVIRTAVGPLDDPSGARIQVAGPPVRMKASHALSFALAVQELGSNAAKFGALSAPGGQVRISWRQTADGQVRFVWDEVGGPPVVGPIAGGFGARLVRQGLARELGGEVHLAPGPEGLSCEIVFRPE